MALAQTACEPERPGRAGTPATLKQADSQGFERAFTPREFRFPDDHGPHPDYRDEWWYVTGNLDGPKRQRYGFQITFFRHGLRRGKRPGASHWSGQDAWMAHFAVTDVEGRRYTSFQRISREAIDLAGASSAPLKVWLDDWRLEADPGKDFPWHLRAAQDDIALNLTLDPRKPAVLQGERGLSQKSAEPGNASYYYSITRLAANGTLTLGGIPQAVTGLAWLDREWSTSLLAPDQAGWDWFSLQLDDGTDLMFFRIRRKQGGDDPQSSGAWIDGEGQSRSLSHGEVTVNELERWRSPLGYDYPSHWRLAIRPTGQTLDIRPVLPDQEFRHDARYWEGAVDVRDPDTGHRLGRGYVEMTGYAPGS